MKYILALVSLLALIITVIVEGIATLTGGPVLAIFGALAVEAAILFICGEAIEHE